MRGLAGDPRVIFIGQGVASDGIACLKDFAGIPADRRIEFPIAEELNIGIALGMSLVGWIPVVNLPRADFLLRAADQIVNHLDKLETISRGQFCPKVIIRVRIGAKAPLDAGPQHTQDHYRAFVEMCRHMNVVRLDSVDSIHEVYRDALAESRPTLVFEKL